MTEPAAGRAPVVVFGDVIDDVIVTPSGDIRPDTDTRASIERRPGGSAANAAAWFGHLGSPTHFFGHVNTADVASHTAHLEAAGVTAHLTGDADLPTGTIVVILQPDRTRTMLTERGANARTSARDVDVSLLAPGGHLHFTGYSLFSDTGEAAVTEFAELIGEARRRGASVSVNPGSAGFLADHGTESLFAATAGADLIIPNLDEGRELTGAWSPEAVVEALLERYPVVALTMGRGGVLAAARDGGTARVEAVPVPPVDTTGAGDAFSAGLVTSLLATALPGAARVAPAATSSDRLAAAATEGVRCASRAIARLGARP